MTMTVLAEFDQISRYSITIKQTNVESIPQHDVFAERRATLGESFGDLNSNNNPVHKKLDTIFYKFQIKISVLFCNSGIFWYCPNITYFISS